VPVTSAPASGGLLAVHAHPDDETLASGALLATWAAAGRPVTVVTCTRGERGEVIGDELAHLEGDGPALAAHRERELAGALAALGVHDHAFLDALPGWSGGRIEDSGMAWDDEGRRAVAAPDALATGTAFTGQELDRLAEPLAALVVRSRPSVVVTYEPGGGYGHPDHVRAHDVTVRALELAERDGFVVPVLLWAVQGRSRAVAAREALRTRESLRALVGPEGALAAPAADDVFASVVVPDDQVGVEVDVAPVRDAVLGALRAHATQVQHVTAVDDDPALAGVYALSLGLAEPLLPTELYRFAGAASTAPTVPAAAGAGPVDGAVAAPAGSRRSRGTRAGVPDVGWPAGVRPVA